LKDNEMEGAKCAACDRTRGDPKNALRYVKAILAGEQHVQVEARLFNYAIATAAVLVVAGALVYSALLPATPDTAAYLPLFLLTIISAVAIVFSYTHIMHYGKSLSCANGMMVGMIMGMLSGFMAGALLGATNGMFIGSVGGMAVGIVLGGNLGRIVGVMGALEGIMAGLMSGIMGAMTSVMMLNDNLVAFLYISSGLCVFMLGGLSYMMHREAGDAPIQERSVRFREFLLAGIILSLALVGIMLYGPKGPVVYP